MDKRYYIFGNWKMNNNLHQTHEFFKEVEKALDGKDFTNTLLGVAVPSIALTEATRHSKKVLVVAQNAHQKDSGAFTGEISAQMLKDANVKYCIVGHSERRAMYNESDKVVNEKLSKLVANGLTGIFCLGENERQNLEGKTQEVVESQLEKGLLGISKQKIKQVIIAYEPIWAIGTGKNATPTQAQETIKVIRDKLNKLYNEDIANSIPILYGGSVNPKNIKDILKQNDINGVLVGGASVMANSFIALFENKN